MPSKALHLRSLQVLVLIVIFSLTLASLPVSGKRKHQAILVIVGGNQTYNPALALLRRGNPELKEVSLTIDDGPHVKWAPKILNALKKHHVHATFFVVGKKVLAHPQLVRRMWQEGHEVGNHSMTHPRLNTITLSQVRYQLQSCANAVAKITGRRMLFMRPPGLRYTPDILRVGKSMQTITVEENIAVGDFIKPGDRSWYEGSKGFAVHVKTVEHNVYKQLRNGAIIVLHDMPVTAAALDDILTGIQKRGYKIVTLRQMLAHMIQQRATLVRT